MLLRSCCLLLALLGPVAALAHAPRDAGSAPSEDWRGTVTRVTDGDSLWVRPAAGGRARRIRIQGIDAPEACQVYGQQARLALAQQVKGRQVRVQDVGVDDYGRLLARLTQQGRDVGRGLVQQGHAWSYRYREDPGPYAQEEAEARQAERGLFAVPQPERPYDFRKRNGPCTWR